MLCNHASLKENIVRKMIIVAWHTLFFCSMDNEQCPSYFNMCNNIHFVLCHGIDNVAKTAAFL